MGKVHLMKCMQALAVHIAGDCVKNLWSEIRFLRFQIAIKE